MNAEEVVMKTLICISLMLMGCATGIRPAYQKDGHQIFEAKCNGLARTIADCHAQASSQCSGKYDVVGTDGTSSFAPMNGGIVPVNKRSLMFTCRAN